MGGKGDGVGDAKLGKIAGYNSRVQRRNIILKLQVILKLTYFQFNVYPVNGYKFRM